MTTLKQPPVAVSSSSAMALCRLVGLACLSGFIVDLLVLGYPVQLGSLEWRTSFIQQMSDRSIILLLGMALLIYSFMEFRLWRKRLATLCLTVGVIFQLSCILVIRDSSALQKQTLGQINERAAQIETRIEESRVDSSLSAQFSPEQLDQAAQQLSLQSEALQENAKKGILRAGISSVGNLVVVGLAMLGLGRYGLRPPKGR